MLRDVVDVDHRRLDVRVAHVGAHVRERERLHRDRAEGVAQVVESQRLEIRPPERRLEATPKRRCIE